MVQEIGNNRDDFENLFREYSDTIYRLCLFKTDNEEIARDLTQETFLHFWKAASPGKVIKKPKQYIYQIARNLIVDYYTSRKTLSLDALRQEGFEPKTKKYSPERIEEIILLRSAIESLDEDFREVMYMHFVEGMDIKEIAEFLDISENLVSVRMNRGKKKLREKFHFE